MLFLVINCDSLVKSLRALRAPKLGGCFPLVLSSKRDKLSHCIVFHIIYNSLKNIIGCNLLVMGYWKKGVIGLLMSSHLIENIKWT